MYVIGEKNVILMECLGKYVMVEFYLCYEELMYFGMYYYFIFLGDCMRIFFVVMGYQ